LNRLPRFNRQYPDQALRCIEAHLSIGIRQKWRESASLIARATFQLFVNLIDSATKFVDLRNICPL